MSLFIGNISRTITAGDLEREFKEFGRCRINFKGSYAFAEFEEEREAEEAFSALKDKRLGGREINLEWSKKSKNFTGDRDRGRERERDKRRRSISPRERRCYNCGSKSHILKDCR